MKRPLALALLAACGATEIPEIKSDVDRDMEPNVSAGDFATLVADNTEFATDLYAQVHGEPGNLFMSPHSISIGLAMTYAGASTNTAAQMASALHFNLPPDQLHAAFNKLDLALASRATTTMNKTIPFRLNTANAMFGQEGKAFQQPFLDVLARNYGVGVHVLDFISDPEGSRTAINHWVEDQTNDRIKDLLPNGTIEDTTRIVLTNAIYFSAAWNRPFKAEETANRPFNLADGSTISVPTLHQVQRLPCKEGVGYRAAELPYDGYLLSMIIVVPDDLATFEASLDAQRMKEIVAPFGDCELTLSLPKFKFVAPLDLNEVLKNLGMVDAFDPLAADFSGIDGTRNLVITDVRHKGFVAIDENGTEAAAATAVVGGVVSLPLPATLTVDKPFVFFIRDRPTGAILFLGRVVDPRT